MPSTLLSNAVGTFSQDMLNTLRLEQEKKRQDELYQRSRADQHTDWMSKFQAERQARNADFANQLKTRSDYDTRALMDERAYNEKLIADQRNYQKQILGDVESKQQAQLAEYQSAFDQALTIQDPTQRYMQVAKLQAMYPNFKVPLEAYKPEKPQVQNNEMLELKARTLQNSLNNYNDQINKTLEAYQGDWSKVPQELKDKAAQTEQQLFELTKITSPQTQGQTVSISPQFEFVNPAVQQPSKKSQYDAMLNELHKDLYKNGKSIQQLGNELMQDGYSLEQANQLLQEAMSYKPKQAVTPPKTQDIQYRNIVRY